MSRPTVSGSTLAWVIVGLGLAVVLVLRLNGTAVPAELWVIIAAAVPSGAGAAPANLIAELRRLVESAQPPTPPVAAGTPAPDAAGAPAPSSSQAGAGTPAPIPAGVPPFSGS